MANTGILEEVDSSDDSSVDHNFDELKISDDDVAGYEASGNDVAGGDLDDDDGAYRPETQKAEPKFQPASALLPDVGAMGSAAARTAAEQEDGKLSGHQRVPLTNANTESMDQSPLKLVKHSFDPAAFVDNAVGPDSHVFNIAVTQIIPTGRVWYGFPANDQKFYTKDGVVVGSWDNVGEIFDHGGVLIPRRE